MSFLYNIHPSNRYIQDINQRANTILYGGFSSPCWVFFFKFKCPYAYVPKTATYLQITNITLHGVFDLSYFTIPYLLRSFSNDWNVWDLGRLIYLSFYNCFGQLQSFVTCFPGINMLFDITKLLCNEIMFDIVSNMNAQVWNSLRYF